MRAAVGTEYKQGDAGRCCGTGNMVLAGGAIIIKRFSDTLICYLIHAVNRAIIAL